MLFSIIKNKNKIFQLFNNRNFSFLLYKNYFISMTLFLNLNNYSYFENLSKNKYNKDIYIKKPTITKNKIKTGILTIKKHARII